MRALLWGLQSPINIGMILRSAEVFGVAVVVHDVHAVFDDPARLRTISDFACGALQRVPPRRIGPQSITEDSRLVATSLEPGATPLPDFRFALSDCLILGNEYDGVPADLVARADIRLRIPMPEGFLPKPPSHNPIDPSRTLPVAHDGRPNLNVAAAAAILFYAAWAQLFSA